VSDLTHDTPICVLPTQHIEGAFLESTDQIIEYSIETQVKISVDQHITDKRDHIQTYTWSIISVTFLWHSVVERPIRSSDKLILSTNHLVDSTQEHPRDTCGHIFIASTQERDELPCKEGSEQSDGARSIVSFTLSISALSSAHCIPTKTEYQPRGTINALTYLLPEDDLEE
jgi:hypothetical protein